MVCGVPFGIEPGSRENAEKPCGKNNADDEFVAAEDSKHLADKKHLRNRGSEAEIERDAVEMCAPHMAVTRSGYTVFSDCA